LVTIAEALGSKPKGIHRRLAFYRLCALIVLWPFVRGFGLIPPAFEFSADKLLSAWLAYSAFVILIARVRWLSERNADHVFFEAAFVGDLLGIILLIRFSGAGASVLAPLLFLWVTEVYIGHPSRAAAAAGLVAGVGYGFAAALWVPASAERASIAQAVGFVLAVLVFPLLLGFVRRAQEYRGLLQARSIADLEALIDEMEARNRHLKAAYRDLAAVHRDTRREQEHLRTFRRLADPGCDYETVAEVAQEAAGTDGAALWLVSDDRSELRLAGAAGGVRRLVGAVSIPMKPDATHPELRRVLENLQAHPDYAKILLSSRLKSRSFAVRRGMDYAAALAFYAKEDEDRLDTLDLRFVSDFVEEVEKALSRIQDREALERRAKELSTLRDLGAAVQETREGEGVFERVLDSIAEVAAYENCTIFVLDRETGELSVRATRGEVVNPIDDVAFAMGRGVSAWVAHERRPIVVADLRSDPRLRPLLSEGTEARSFASIPLLSGRRIVGVINISHSKPNRFSQRELDILGIIASQAAATIEKSLAYENLELLAITDPLTRAYNRRYLELRLDEELARAKRYGVPLSLIMLDIDRFKRVNDEFGHSVGDDALRELVAVVSQIVRETEIVSRYGGEEFVIVFPQTSGEDCASVGERARRTVEGHLFCEESTPDGIRLTVSAGVATYPADAADAKALIDAADRALYDAKRAGRNKVAIHRREAAAGAGEKEPRGARRK
jgi:diguanylate cyclase (GGDEF)-like protein